MVIEGKYTQDWGYIAHAANIWRFLCAGQRIPDAQKKILLVDHSAGYMTYYGWISNSIVQARGGISDFAAEAVRNQNLDVLLVPILGEGIWIMYGTPVYNTGV